MKSRKLSIPYIFWMLIFTMIPIVMIGLTAFRNKAGEFSLEPFVKAYDYRNVFLKSLWIAFLSTLICLVLAYPIAYLLSKMKKTPSLFQPVCIRKSRKIFFQVPFLQDPS